MSQSNQTPKKPTKKKYHKPKLKKEKVMTFGAGCNGMATGGRKAVPTGIDPCSTMKLLS